MFLPSVVHSSTHSLVRLCHIAGGRQRSFQKWRSAGGRTATVATSPMVLYWLCDSQRMGCMRRTNIYLRGVSKQ